jgi:hypothetical protein
MSIPRKDETRYNLLLARTKDNIIRPYVSPVLELLEKKGRKTTPQVLYNVLKGTKKDFQILYALAEYAGVKRNKPRNQSQPFQTDLL